MANATVTQLPAREPETKRADQFIPGDYIGESETGHGCPLRVLHTQRFEPQPRFPVIGLTVADLDGKPQLLYRDADRMLPVASEDEVSTAREVAERADRIAEIRALAAWLEANPWAPMPYRVEASQHLDSRHVGGMPESDAIAKVREIGERLGVAVEERLDDRTAVRFPFGHVEYSVIAWHPDGRPELRVPFDGTGFDYTRADDGDDPQPVAGREPMHTGGMTESGLVDESERPSEFPPHGWHVKGCLGATGRSCTCDMPASAE